MALMKRLAMRRRIRETSEEALAANPPLPNAEQPAPTGPAAKPAQPAQPPAAASRPVEHAFAAEALMPDIAELPEVPLESMWPTQPESDEQQPSAPDPAPSAPVPDRRPESETSSATNRSAGPAAPPNPSEEQWQLPQWQYATKRARLNQRGQRK